MRLRAPVERIAWDADGVRVTAAGAETSADAVVIAVPASVIDRIAFDPPLPVATASALAAVRYGQAGKALPAARRPRGAQRDAVRARPVLDVHAARAGRQPAPGRGIVRRVAARPRAAPRHRGSGGWIAAVRDLRPDLAVRAEDAVLSTWADDPWTRGAYSAHSFASRLDEAALCRPVGPLHFAGEHTAGEWHALMEGALRSGLRAAAELTVTHPV